MTTKAPSPTALDPRPRPTRSAARTEALVLGSKRAANDTELLADPLPNERAGSASVLTKDQERQLFQQLSDRVRRLFALSMQSPWGLCAFDDLYEKIVSGTSPSEALPSSDDESSSERDSSETSQGGAGASTTSASGARTREALLAWKPGLRRLLRRGAPHWRCLEESSPQNNAASSSDIGDDDARTAAVAALERNREQLAASADRAGISPVLREKLIDAVRARRALDSQRDASPVDVRSAHCRRKMRELELQIDRIKSHVVASNQGLVHFVMRRYCDLGMAWPDLVQEGNIGLMRAVEKFDVERGVRFNTYAVWWIRQAARRALSNQSRTIRVPVHVLDTRHTVARAHSRLSLQLGRMPTSLELAQETGVPQEQVEQLATLAQEPLSLQAPRAPDSGTSLLETVVDPGADTDDSTMAADRRAALEKLLGDLTEREQHVLRMRFGLEGGDEYTLVQVGEAIGVTRERARQILQASLLKLRQAAARRRIDLSLLN